MYFSTYVTKDLPKTDSQELTPDVVDSVVELFLCLWEISGLSFKSTRSRYFGSWPFMISKVLDSDSDRLCWAAEGVWFAGKVRDFNWVTGGGPERDNIKYYCIYFRLNFKNSYKILFSKTCSIKLYDVLTKYCCPFCLLFEKENCFVNVSHYNSVQHGFKVVFIIILLKTPRTSLVKIYVN